MRLSSRHQHQHPKRSDDQNSRNYSTYNPVRLAMFFYFKQKLWVRARAHTSYNIAIFSFPLETCARRRRCEATRRDATRRGCRRRCISAHFFSACSRANKRLRRRRRRRKRSPSAFLTIADHSRRRRATSCFSTYVRHHTRRAIAIAHTNRHRVSVHNARWSTVRAAAVPRLARVPIREIYRETQYSSTAVANNGIHSVQDPQPAESESGATAQLHHRR